MHGLERWTRAVAMFLLLTAQPLFSAVAQGEGTIAFVNVDVIPMDTERVLADQTVLVQGDRIVGIGAADAIQVPAEAQLIDGNGGYLIPGLTDAHFHILDNEDSLILALANGVTTVRDPNATYAGTGQAILDARDRIAAGERLGPTITAAKSFAALPPRFASAFSNIDQAVGPWLSVDRAVFELAADPIAGRDLVFKAFEEGYDIVKINWFLSRETFDAIVAAAAELGMPVLAHVPADVGVEGVIRAGGEIQHNGNLMAFVAKDYVRRPGANYLDTFDLSEADTKLPELVALMVESGVAFTPTMIGDVAAFELFDNLPDWSRAPIFQRPEYRYVPPAYLAIWTDPRGGEIAVVLRDSGASSIEEIVPPAANREEILAYHLKQLKALVDAGVPVLVGTDASALGIVWGFAIHRELELFVQAGLTPYQALAAATRIPSEVIGDPGEWGTIEVGKRADLVLLAANPLDDIANTRQIQGVMVRGQWHPQTELQAMLDDIAARYDAQAAGVPQLQPFTSDLLAITGLAPSGWRELQPGLTTRGNPDDDPTFLFQLSAPVGDILDQIRAILARFEVTDALPDPIATIQSEAFTWNLYSPETPLPLGLAVALTDTDERVYAVVLVAPEGELDALAGSVFMPAVMALAPVE